MRRWPEHLRKNAKRRAALRRIGRIYRGFYGVPVYLCGSALLDFNADPRDWDLRLRLPDTEFRRRFGDPIEFMQRMNSGDWRRVNYRWSRDCVKSSKDAWIRTGLNVDFQIVTWENWKHYRKHPRFRLA